jgi:cell division protein FtsL
MWLAVAVLACALGVVHTRQESRRLFSELQNLRAERDALDVEWGQLLLEEGAWSQHRRVETAARTRLDMSLPQAERIVVLRLEGKP